MYVDEFIYLSTSSEVEEKFENDLKLLPNLEFIGPPQYFLDLKVKYKEDEKHLSIFISQETATIELVHRTSLSNISTK